MPRLRLMIEIEVHIPSSLWSDSIPYLVEKLCANEGLTLTLKGTLAKYSKCLHWHYKKGKASGTLEITWWETENRLWFKVTAGRRAAWMEEAIDRLKKQIESALE
jgi:hypothetical protein